ncbi:Nif3-like dinuclear metal center hexameric protein [Thalassobacillus sp. CUG 92003]|uniref:Nif3-like dinuclear metal center hexameric protein n=1 Tax=Thalassobacillus sp. CUG 92003 TaxID=2736641 RepID=UPI0015E65270|nr:Nif3-like dinuclear metal center hexameric protein [Thalassobacillus sp. CUG 92003]
MNPSVQGTELIHAFEKWCPPHLAYEWDNVGLNVGTLNKPVRNVMITLDVMENVVDEAIENQVDLIVAHHPVIFKPLSQIHSNDPKGRVITKLLKHDISVYTAHTNLDIVEGGVNDAMAHALQLEQLESLVETHREELIKLVVFVPEDYADTVRDAISQAGAGHIGDYSHCTFQSGGEGTFKPLEGTNPFIGNQGEIEKAAEKRVETIVPKHKLSDVLQAMEASHPYEEAAYDVYPLKNQGKLHGIGRVGVLEEPVTLETFCSQVKTAFDVPALRVTGSLDDMVKRVAVLGGSGEKFIDAAQSKDADVYVTGDMTLHPAQDAWAMGLNVVDPGHHVEKLMKRSVQSFFNDTFNHEAKQVHIMISEAPTEPFQFV